jgi:hypothetical protein
MRRALTVSLKLVVAVALCLGIARHVGAQTMQSKGLAVSPAFEGWLQNPDGSIDVVFGYMNSNWQEEFDVPVGPENNIEPGGPDQGQPMHFFPRRNRYVFKVRVPKDFGDKELVWTLTTNGKTRTAYGSLNADYLLNDLAMETDLGTFGGGTVTTPEIRMNTPPSLDVIGETVLKAKVGVPLTVAAHATDDGLPPSRERGNRAVGSQTAEEAGVTDLRLIPPRQITQSAASGSVWVSCIVYRAVPGARVAINPDQVETWEDTRTAANSPWAPRWRPPTPPSDGRWQAQVTFDRPGEYVLRWHATDGGLFADRDVHITVTP